MSVIGCGELFGIAKLAFGLGHEQCGLALVEHLLAHLPNYVPARTLLGENLVAAERWVEAEGHLESVLQIYPTDLSALRGMGCAALAKGLSGEESEHLLRAWELYPYDATTRELVNGSLGNVSPLSLARIFTASSLHDEALPYYEAAVEQASARPSERPVALLLLAQALWKTGHMGRARSLLETLAGQQPMWARPKVIMADIMLEAREDALGVALLHDASALDPSLLVAEELLGQDEKYDSFMRTRLEVSVPGSELMASLPMVLRYLFHLEPLPEPLGAEDTALEESAPVGSPDRIGQKGGGRTTAGEELGKVACLSLASEGPKDEAPLSCSEREVPVRLILSSRERLVAKYADHGYRQLDAKLSELVEVGAAATGHDVLKIYVDDESCLNEYDVKPADPSDPQDVDRMIQELESELGRRSRRIESVLIIGGDFVIPFHRLANPADDDDGEVLSDWPYAAVDGSPLLARFSVGRMPDGQSADSEVLLHVVENAIRHHRAGVGANAFVTSSTWRSRILKGFGSRKRAMSSIGYSAQIWAEAARSVFQAIGDASSLMLSPPLTDYDFLTTRESIPRLAYFNLHGFRGSPYWYGHAESEDGLQLLPVALTPLAISWMDAEAAFIYSEACYGADLRNQGADGTLAESFLGNGALGFIGFTSMSYGSLEPPLSGADLVGRHLWEGITAGLPIGLALRRARTALMQTAAAEQGYLDAEDQKTLMSLVLYGDPSACLAPQSASSELKLEPEVACPPMACHRKMLESESMPVSAELREKVQRSLPFPPQNGLNARPLIICDGACSVDRCAMPTSGAPSQVSGSFPDLIVTSQQEADTKAGNHLQHVVKVTVTSKGDVTKVLMSRGGQCVDEWSRQR